MRTVSVSILMAVLLINACTSSGTSNTAAPSGLTPNGTTYAENPSAARTFGQFPIAAVSKYPTVGLKEYILITDDLERDRAEAEAVLETKIGLTHAMQTKERKDFESVLGRSFVFRAFDEFFDRDSYINGRVSDNTKVKQADYRNMVMQFVTPDRALITYSNIVEDQPGGPGAWKADMTWADILVKENGRWIYQIMHQIEFKDLTVPK